MQCPECGSPSRILETRRAAGGLKRRRYQCHKLHRFTTLGTAENLSISPMINPQRAQQEVVKRSPVRGPSTKPVVPEVRSPWSSLHAMFFKETNYEEDLT
jgi:transcriptional regulator NrdR family protein